MNEIEKSNISNNSEEDYKTKEDEINYYDKENKTGKIKNKLIEINKEKKKYNSR